MIKASQVFNNIKTFYQGNRWRGRIILALLVLVFILGLARLLLPPTIIYSTTSWLKGQGIDSSIEAINIDIIDGTVSLVNAKGYREGKQLFNIDRVDIYWHWAPLTEKTIVVTKVGLNQLKVNIEKYQDEIIIGGVHLPLNTAGTNAQKGIDSDKEGSGEQAKPWAASLGEVIFSNLKICYLQHTVPIKQADTNSLFADYCVDLEEMSWAGTISYATDKSLLNTDDLPISSTGNFTVNGLHITDNKLSRKVLVSTANTLDNVVISGLNSLHIDELDMEELSLLQRDDDKHIDSVRFSRLTVDGIKLTDLNTLAISNISINSPGVYLLKENETDWEYQQWIPGSSATGNKIEKAEAEEPTASESPFALSLSNINIKNSDLCYQDNSTSLYYCLTFNDFSWQGQVKFDTRPASDGGLNLRAEGDLKLSQPVVHNQMIDRNLVDLDTVKLSGLNVSGIDDVTLRSFNIDKLASLQRSKNKDDGTVSFDQLDIDDIHYTKNKIEISSIDLKGLSSTVSKNKKGGWEHDKWIQKDEDKKPEDTSKATQKSADGEPFVIALKKVKVTSKKKILFTDNSTEPATEAGLQSVAIIISNIYSDKPGSVTPFELQAQTILHSTIELKGTAKPFAEKVSIDANGKLKGFDLRAASPATKKAIGHIIKSGQLDADLKLQAVEGKLDSNIALSLYHFNIKATSKEDAKKLDDMFGMPLNQTLVLLRDKDDSIHLDIPITGDVNNPNFDPMDAIIKATSKAATVTLITFYTPYGLIYAGGNIAFNLATALNFDPIDFTPGSAEVLAEGKTQLDNLSKLLTEKPQVHLTLCGITNQQDVFKLYPEIKDSYDRSKTDEEKSSALSLNAERSSKLEKLAGERQVNSKNYLINNSGIAHNRLILCEPEHRKEDDAIAGVEINI